ncbi:MAG: redoxin family protein [Planctomycetota bacterium]|nr:MAG: redoxin family protein [Planctomycetota bacterium]
MNRFGKGVLAAAVMFLMAGVCGAAYEPKTLEIGSTAPFFHLPGVDGKHYSLVDFAGAKVLVMIFTSNHCPTARAYEDRMKKLTADYKDKGVAVVAISSNDPCALRLDELAWTDVGDTLEDMKIRAKDKEFNFPYLYDGDTQKVAKAYGPETTPHTLIFDEYRTLRYVGRNDSSEWMEKADAAQDARNAIDALLAGEKVTVEKTKTFGCSIKWSDKRAGVKKEREELEKEAVALEPIDAEVVRGLVKDNKDKLRLINVWATWCGPCKVEMPELIKIYWIYRNRRTTEFELITISADPSHGNDGVLSFLKEHHASCKNYLYGSANKYELIEAVDKEWAGAIPYTILVAPGGKILYRQMGIVEPLELRRAIVGYYEGTLPWWVSEEG